MTHEEFQRKKLEVLAKAKKIPVTHTPNFAGEYRKQRINQIKYEILQRGQVDREFFAASFSDYLPETENQMNFYIIKEFADTIEKRREKGDFLYMFSENDGKGKTLLACCILGQYAQIMAEKLFESDYRYQIGCNLDYSINPVLFFPVRQAMQEIKDSWDSGPEAMSCEWYRMAINSDILVLDDFFACLTTEWMIAQIWQIIDYRWRKKKPTIFTSNQPLSVLLEYEESGKTMFGRIAQRCTQKRILKFVGESFRVRAAIGE